MNPPARPYLIVTDRVAYVIHSPASQKAIREAREAFRLAEETPGNWACLPQRQTPTPERIDEIAERVRRQWNIPASYIEEYGTAAE